jgi:hypothetical protein
VRAGPDVAAGWRAGMTTDRSKEPQAEGPVAAIGAMGVSPREA